MDNQLIELNIKNGNNTALSFMWAFNNPSLDCIQVDDVNYANNRICDMANVSGWCKDETSSYGDNCQMSVEDFTITDFQLFPNPAGNLLNIQSKENIENVKIYSTQGVLVKEVASKTMDISQLSAGMYFVRIAFGGKGVTKKFIKQ